MFDVQFGGPFCCDCFIARDEDGSLGAVVVCYSENSIIAIGDRQFSDKVQCDGFKGECIDLWGNGHQGCMRWMIVDLIMLTFRAPSDVLQYIPPQPRPPIVALDQLCSPFDARVSVHRGVVVSFDDGTLIVHPSRDHPSGILVPGSSYQSKVIGTHPWFKYLGVLSIHQVRRFHIPGGDFGRGVQCGLHRDRSHEYVFREDRHRLVVVLSLMVIWSSGQSVCACVFLALDMVNLIIIFGKFEYFPGDAQIDVLWRLPVL